MSTEDEFATFELRSAGSLAATERHLKDMQAIALGLLRKDGLSS